jgi:hypothetical protein
VVDVPEGGRLLTAGHDLVVTLVRDELDVETVFVYEVR